MNDLIHRQTVVELVHSLYPSMPKMPKNIERWKEKYAPYIELEKMLEYIPPVHSEIVTCKDCVYSGDNSIAGGRYWCERHNAYMRYCSEAIMKPDMGDRG